MLKTYTLHVPADADVGDPDALEDADLVKDGFAWVPFLLGPFSFLWFFWHRLWLAGLGVLLAVLSFGLLVQLSRMGTGSAFVAELLLSILIGLEANSLKRWTWRRKKPAVDVVSASDIQEAETKAFARWLAGAVETRPSHVTGSLAPAPYRGEPVIGLFPEMERPR
jgi:hypothetical protein